MLAAIKDIAPHCRFYFAGSSEMFGKVAEIPQIETTRFHPRSAYGISKVAGFDLTRNYREAYGLFACGGMLFNHESARRGHEFVTRKISSGAAAIAAGKASQLRLGNLDARRDWGHAPDYVEAMWLMLQQDVSRRLRDRNGRDAFGAGFLRTGFFECRAGLPRPRGARFGTVPARGSGSADR